MPCSAPSYPRHPRARSAPAAELGRWLATNLLVTQPLFEFKCGMCGEVHLQRPAWHFAAPIQVSAVPPAEREVRVDLTEDDCVIDEKEFYLKALLELPIIGSPNSFVWGVWLSVSAESHARFAASFTDVDRSPGEPFFGWLCNELPSYPSTQLLKTMVHVRDYPLRPWIELEPTNHPLAIDQRNGISVEKAILLTEAFLHPSA